MKLPDHGLNDKDFIPLYNAGKIEKIKRGTYLIKEGEEEQTIYLVLEGIFKVLKTLNGYMHMISVLTPGSWVGEMALLRKAPRTASILASTEATVLVLNEKALNSLTSNQKIILYEHLGNIASQRTDSLIRTSLSYKVQTQALANFNKNKLKETLKLYQDSDLIQTIIKGIPELPVYSQSILYRLKDHDITPKEIVQGIKEDPSLGAMIMKRVNSAYFGFQKKIMDLQHAIVLLGFNQIYQLALYRGIRSTMPDTIEFRRLHLHSTILSYIAFELALLANAQNKSFVATLGLLHDVGKSIILLLVQKHPKMGLIFESLNSSQLGAMLFREWKLPEEICESIACQEYIHFASPEDISKNIRNSVAVLSISHLVLDYLEYGHEGFSEPAFLQEYLNCAGLKGHKISELAKNQLLPELAKKRKILPAAMRRYLEQRLHVFGYSVDTFDNNEEEAMFRSPME